MEELGKRIKVKGVLIFFEVAEPLFVKRDANRFLHLDKLEQK